MAKETVNDPEDHSERNDSDTSIKAHRNLNKTTLLPYLGIHLINAPQ
jgi:hypothetical protein